MSTDLHSCVARPERPFNALPCLDSRHSQHHDPKKDGEMFIVDSQVHIWKEETPDRPWIKGARDRMALNGHRLEPFSYQECLELMDQAGVNRALILPPSW